MKSTLPIKSKALPKKLRTILAELRRQFEALYGERLAQMKLFGSQARGDAVEGSDIDVLVVLSREGIAIDPVILQWRH